MGNPWVYVGGLILLAAIGLALVLAVLSLRSRRLVKGDRLAIRREGPRLVRWVIRVIRIVVVLLAGLVVLAAGVVMLVTPGPGIPTILLGLAILASEFVWARIILRRLLQVAGLVGERVGLTARELPPDAGRIRRYGFAVGQFLRPMARRLGLSAVPVRGSGKLSPMQALIVTLDGPAGSGKSSVARLLAQRLGVMFLDTGAMYRGLTALCLEQAVDPGQDPQQAVALGQRARFRFDWHTDPPRLHIEYAGVDRDVTDRLRDADVTRAVSDIACNSGVRRLMVAMQQRIGEEHPRLVTEGRDQGSVVFPKAQVKFYLDARPQIRAHRRAEQLRQAGKPADEAQILPQIIERDRRDMARPDGPLVCPEGAIRVDTSDMTLPQVVDTLERQVRERAAASVSGASAAQQG